LPNVRAAGAIGPMWAQAKPIRTYVIVARMWYWGAKVKKVTSLKRDGRARPI
jgi:hypothetical protein